MAHTKNKWDEYPEINKWHFQLHCDVQVIRYWIWLLSQAANNSKILIWTDPHLIWTPCGSIYFPPHHSFWNCSFFLPPSLCVPSSLSTLPSFLPSTSMPPKPGPWSLDNVKARLRQEQVEREKEASRRYRQLEARRAKEETVGGTSLSRCVLVVFVLCFVLLSVVAIALCAVIVSLLKKE